MPQILLAAALSVTLTLIASSIPRASCAAGIPAGWHTNVASAQAAAAENHRPIIVFFTAQWCGYCRKMEKETLSDATVSRRLKEQFVPLLIDVDEHPDLAKRLKVRGFPSTLVFDAQGKLLDRTTGYLSPSKAIAWLDNLSSTSDVSVSRPQQAAHAE